MTQLSHVNFVDFTFFNTEIKFAWKVMHASQKTITLPTNPDFDPFRVYVNSSVLVCCLNFSPVFALHSIYSKMMSRKNLKFSPWYFHPRAEIKPGNFVLVVRYCNHYTTYLLYHAGEVTALIFDILSDYLLITRNLRIYWRANTGWSGVLIG